MAAPSAIASQLGFKQESTFGTPVTVDTFIPLVSESITQEIERLESAGMIAGRRLIDTDQWKAGNKTISGDLQFELYEQSIGTLLKHCLGATSTSGSGPYTHVLTPDTLTGLGLTVQVGRPDTAGTVRPFTYAGCKVVSWELAIEAGQIATMGVTVEGTVAEATGTALASASYAAQATRPFTAIEVSVGSIGGTTTNIKKFSLSGDNSMDVDRRFIGSALPSQPLEGERRNYEGEVSLEFSSLTDYNRFVNGTEADILVTLSNGVESIAINAHARFDGTTPTVGGPGLLMLDQPFRVLGDGTDADGLTITVINDDATV